MGPLYKFIASVSSFALFSGGFFAGKSAQAVEVDTEAAVSSSSNPERILQDEQLSSLLDDVIKAHAEIRVAQADTPPSPNQDLLDIPDPIIPNVDSTPFFTPIPGGDVAGDDISASGADAS
ncbi:hypothetical protein UF64_06975 [Thalassospira sp. HJ]|uniref:hypothetical protein n=1 Tax=Thalassospira sp. HJ TaxID=1616823 RepID=UPI0005CE6F94|nr:hypothetical protein [Thalassospira sp. HJ]KJE35848.1 hypothetical protein UF64_06975 [Thalassospira sp. HJ]